VSRDENLRLAMAGKDDLDERVTIRVSSKALRRLQELADADKYKPPISVVAREILMRELEHEQTEAAA
jgi:predicted transcriptional regulator